MQKKEIDKLQKQAEDFETQVKSLTLDRMNEAPLQEVEPQTKLSSKEIDKSAIYLKPERSIRDPAKFNEEFRKDWEFAQEIVQFIAEHKELIGESIELWTRPFGGTKCEYWKVPTNKPVWGPRYLAEQIRRKFYHRLHMDESRMTNSEGGMTYFGAMVAQAKIQRLTAEPVYSRKSVFMGEKIAA